MAFRNQFYTFILKSVLLPTRGLWVRFWRGTANSPKIAAAIGTRRWVNPRFINGTRGIFSDRLAGRPQNFRPRSRGSEISDIFKSNAFGPTGFRATHFATREKQIHQHSFTASDRAVHVQAVGRRARSAAKQLFPDSVPRRRRRIVRQRSVHDVQPFDDLALTFVVDQPSVVHALVVEFRRLDAQADGGEHRPEPDAARPERLHRDRGPRGTERRSRSIGRGDSFFAVLFFFFFPPKGRTVPTTSGSARHGKIGRSPRKPFNRRASQCLRTAIIIQKRPSFDVCPSYCFSVFSQARLKRL